MKMQLLKVGKFYSRLYRLRAVSLFYILIRYPAQTNIKYLSCNKQPHWGVSTRAVCDPLYYAFINKMDGNNTTNRMKTWECKKLQQEK